MKYANALRIVECYMSDADLRIRFYDSEGNQHLTPEESENGFLTVEGARGFAESFAAATVGVYWDIEVVNKHNIVKSPRWNLTTPRTMPNKWNIP